MTPCFRQYSRKRFQHTTLCRSTSTTVSASPITRLPYRSRATVRRPRRFRAKRQRRDDLRRNNPLACGEPQPQHVIVRAKSVLIEMNTDLLKPPATSENLPPSALSIRGFSNPECGNPAPIERRE